MTTGVLIFAYNNEHIDYLAMANWSAKNIRRHLNLPVAVVTNVAPPSNFKFEQVIYAPTVDTNTRHFSDYNANVVWHNNNRVDAYNLSPWTETLVLDADYVVASNQLNSIINLRTDFMAHKTAYDITGLHTFTELNVFGSHRMPMWWATVMKFRRSKKAEAIFDCMQMIRDNWKHYRNLYDINRSTYRNDYALSIALGIVNGHTLSHSTIPWGLASLTPDHKLTQISADTYRIDYISNGKPRYITLTQDFHAMGKKQLGEIVENNS